MSFKIVYGDILKTECDAIVNSTNAFYSGGGGLDREIHTQAGPELWEACGYLGRLHKGEARLTDGYNLSPRKIIHTNGPSWKGGYQDEEELVEKCYENSILLASEKKLKTVAFPLISSKFHGFPKSLAITAAINGIKSGLESVGDSVDVLLVLYARNRDSNLKQGIDIVNKVIHSVNPEVEVESSEPDMRGISASYSRDSNVLYESIDSDSEKPEKVQDGIIKSVRKPVPSWLDDLIEHPTKKHLEEVPIDESFGVTLNKIMDEKNFAKNKLADELGMSGAGVWKFMTDKSVPNRMTVMGIIIILELDITQAEDLLAKAGYSFSPSSVTDGIIKECVNRGFYDRYVIDELLYSLDLQTLPGAIID